MGFFTHTLNPCYCLTEVVNSHLSGAAASADPDRILDLAPQFSEYRPPVQCTMLVHSARVTTPRRDFASLWRCLLIPHKATEPASTLGTRSLP